MAKNLDLVVLYIGKNVKIIISVKNLFVSPDHMKEEGWDQWQGSHYLQ